MTKCKNIFIFFAVFLFCFYAFYFDINAETYNAASCSYFDVLAAYNAASAGDTVAIPAGTCTWPSTLNINKSINLIGAGSSFTNIIWGGSTANNTLVNINLSSDVPIRISGIHFDLLSNNPGAYRHGIYVSGKCLTKVRIDNNKFTKGHGGAIFVNGKVWGVIDNNIFFNGSIPIYVNGDNSGWGLEDTIAAGTNKALFIEDNTFIVNDDSEQKDPDAIVYVQQGASTVIRYNTVDATEFTTGNFHAFNHHGNQNYYTGKNDFRSQPISEIYNNIISFYKTYGNLNGFRGGSILFYNNKYTQIVGTVPLISLTEEECWQTAMFNPLRTEWPAQDQIINTFIWNNTYNGIISSSIHFANLCDSNFIKENRDYFLHPPQASGGYGYYTGSRKGGSTTYPTLNDTGSTTFSPNGPNAYYPYTPYIYPHPLRQELRLTGPDPPKNLKIIP